MKRKCVDKRNDVVRSSNSLVNVIKLQNNFMSKFLFIKIIITLKMHDNMELLYHCILRCSNFTTVFDGSNGLGDAGEFNPIFNRIAEWGVRHMSQMEKYKSHDVVDPFKDSICGFITIKDFKSMLVKMIETEEDDKEFMVENLPNIIEKTGKIQNKKQFVKIMWAYFVGNDEDE